MSPEVSLSGQASRLAGETGVFAPLLAIISIALIFILISYGIDSSTVRQASKALEKYNEQVCRQVASRPVIHRDAVESFRRQIQRAVDENLITNVKLLNARMTLPAMPKDGDFAFTGKPVSEPYVATPQAFGGFDCPGGSARCLECKINCSGGTCQDCEFSGNVVTTTSFPASMWDNLKNAGNTVACELSGSVNTVLLGQKALTARTVWAATVRGEFRPQPTPGPNDNPGISLVIAPELQSRAGDARFRFSTNSSFFDNVEFRPKYDPLFSFNRYGNPPGVNAFFHPSNSYVYPAAMAIPTFTATPGATSTSTPMGGPPAPPPLPTAEWRINSSAALSSRYRAELPSGGGAASDDKLPKQNRTLIGSDYGSDPDCMGYSTPAPGTNCMVLSDREEMLAACMSPVVLVRNIITSTILEGAMRHGEMRNMTEVLVANPKNRNEKSADYSLNNPVQIIAHGEDLGARAYQLPFVFFHGGGDIYGNDADLPKGHGGDPDYRPHQFGVINPFDQAHHQIAALPPASQASIDSILSRHRFLAGQLRSCYHMFHDEESQAIARFDIPGFLNDNFEPNSSAEEEVYSFETDFRESYPDLPDDVWDQEYPWGGGTPSNTRGLNGPELVSALGSVQICPYYEAGLPSPPFPTPQVTPTPPAPKAGICLKPNNPQEDLRGDLLGALCYLKGSTSSSVCPASFPGMSAGVFPAIRPPGVFAMLNPHAANPTFDGVDLSKIYASPVNLTTPIVLVTHQPLTLGERLDIRRLINEGHFDHRPITVIFVQAWEKPGELAVGANQNYLDNSIIQDFKQAFNIPDHYNPGTGERDNAIFVFSPYLKDLTLSTGCQAGGAGNPAICFSEYWKYLLDSSHEENIHVAANNIFYNRILRVMLKL